MKKQIAAILASLLLYTTAHAEPWLSIAELQKQVPAHWTKTYQTAWRDISIDAEIRVPQVDKLPVLLISGGAAEPQLTAEEAGWDEIEYRGPYDILLVNNIPAYPKKVDGVRVGSPVSKGNWYSGFAPENTYVPMDDTNLGEIITQAKVEISRFGYDPNVWELDHPRRISAHHVYAKGTEQDVLPGFIYLEVRTKLEGIPVLSHIWDAVVSHQGTTRNDEFWLPVTSDIAYDGYLGGLSHLYLTPLAIRTMLAEDIPLCPFDRILSVIEAEIEEGRIRKIYEIELGYVLYNEPGIYRGKGNGEQSTYEQYQSARYYARPMWQVNCLYVERASGNLRNVSGYTDDERNSIDYYQLLIDAQTGALVEQSSARDRCEFKGFISWEDVQ